MAVKDHGLEVLKKAGSDIGSTPKTEYAVVQLNHAHFMIHKGRAFSTGHVFTGVVSTASVNFHIKTGSKELHTNFNISASKSIRVYFYEEPTISGNGTEKTLFNLNRSSTQLSTANAYHTASYSNGTLIRDIYINGGSGGNAQGGHGGGPVKEETEMILKANASYIILMNNISVGAAVIGIETGHYE